jgi:katanin p80 WD40 repeat-containing subunit B1
MTAGKLIHSIDNIQGTINSISFHPTEFLMAVSSTDGFIKVFDLQSFECISTSQKINNPKLANFSQDGTLVYMATSDSFKTFSWEPWTSVNSVDAFWQNIDDFYVFEKEKRVVGVSKDSNLVGVWMIDLAVSDLILMILGTI